MGYTTDFSGSFKFKKAPSEEQINFINAFSNSRRMGRDVQKLKDKWNGEYGLDGNYGTEGEYFILDMNSNDPSILDYNRPPSTQPGLWCQWIIEEQEDSKFELVWDGGEKFYEYEAWLQYMLDHFFNPWGLVLNGKVKWQGEEMDDRGLITVKNNVMTVKNLK